MLQVGIVGLPNVGKSTLFNALTRSRKAESANYPFCTIEPNVGVVEVPDERPWKLKELVGTNKVILAAIEFLDIAGLVAGASKGEGLGNKFLSNIREVDAIVHVVRCFVDDDVIHNEGSVDPIRDIEIITTELILSDMESAEAQKVKYLKKAKSGDKEAIARATLLERIIEVLNEGKPASILEYDELELLHLRHFGLLSIKPVLYACNVAEDELASAKTTNPYVAKVQDYVSSHHDAGICVISAKLESELAEFSPEEGQALLEELGVQDSGVSELIRASYDLLGLASYFTAGEQEVRAWTFRDGMKAPECAGVIHTDFEKNFIKAEVVSYDDLVSCGSYQGAKEAGKYRLEGKEYAFKDGDVALFRFSP